MTAFHKGDIHGGWEVFEVGGEGLGQLGEGRSGVIVALQHVSEQAVDAQ